MTVRTLIVALILLMLCLPLFAETPIPAAVSGASGANRQVRLAVTYALVSDADIQAAQLNTHPVLLTPSAYFDISPRPWGEGHLEYPPRGGVCVGTLEVQAASGNSTALLLAALTQAGRLNPLWINTVQSGVEGQVAFQTTEALAQSGTPASLLQSLGFSLRPVVNGDGTVSLGFLPRDQFVLPAMGDGSQGKGSKRLAIWNFADVATVRSGETVVLTQLLGGLHLGKNTVIVFVTPTVLERTN